MFRRRNILVGRPRMSSIQKMSLSLFAEGFDSYKYWIDLNNERDVILLQPYCNPMRFIRQSIQNNPQQPQYMDLLRRMKPYIRVRQNPFELLISRLWVRIAPGVPIYGGFPPALPQMWGVESLLFEWVLLFWCNRVQRNFYRCDQLVNLFSDLCLHARYHMAVNIKGNTWL